MPSYEYLCDLCGRMVIKQSIHEAALYECPDCNSTNFRKIYGRVGVQFKGSGFYSTDSKGK